MPSDEINQLRNQIKALFQRMRREQPAVEGVSSTELHVLTVLERSAMALRPGQLGAELQMTSPNVAAALRSLEVLRMVSRRHDPQDGRQRLVAVTELGQKLVAKTRRTRHAWLRSAIENSLSDKERRLLLRAGALMQRLADETQSRHVKPMSR